MGLNIQLQTEPHPVLAMEIRSMGKMGARRWAKHSRGPVTQAPWLHCGSIQPPLKTPIPDPIARFLNSGEWKLFKVEWLPKKKWKKNYPIVWEVCMMMVIGHTVSCLWWPVTGVLQCLCTAQCVGAVLLLTFIYQPLDSVQLSWQSHISC